MVTPDRRRMAVVRLQTGFGVSERRACAVVGQHRSTQRRSKAPPDAAEAQVDEFTREALAVEAAHSIDSERVVATAERLVADRGAPTHLRIDNGPELISAALRDWCRIRTDTPPLPLGAVRENFASKQKVL